MMFKSFSGIQGIFGLLLLIQTLHLAVSQDCTLPEELWGNWTSTNLGTIVITGSSPSLTFTVTFTAQNVSVNEMQCRFTSGTQYILESKYQIYTFSSTNPIFMWMCLDLRRASAYSYYYYLNSPKEVGFENYRLVGLPDTSTTASDVCTTTLDTAEFNMMIKVGHETDAVNAVQCADDILGSFSYTYTNSDTTHCENTVASFINACDNANKTHILVNNSDCAAVNPFYSTSGQLGCIANVYDSATDVYYISLYNLDTSPTTQFVCTAVQKTDNGTVYLSMRQTECTSGQTPTALPTGGATMVLTPSYTCLDSQSKKRSWIWLYILLPCLFLLIIFIMTCLCLYSWLKKREVRRARKKTALADADHPLGEVSLKLDAPASLGMQHGYIDRKRDLLEKPARRRMSEDREDLFGEQSLDLNLEGETWKHLERRKRPVPIENGFSGAIVNESISNGSVPKTKSHNSIGGRLKSKTRNFLTARMAANNLKTRANNHSIKSYERSTKASSSRGPTIKLNNGVHPEPIHKSSKSVIESRATSRADFKATSRPASRAISRASSRRGSIDNLVISRSLRSSKILRSKTMVLEKPKEENRLDIYTMPEEFVTEGDRNEVRPSRPGNIPQEYKSLTRRSHTHTTLRKPGASKKPWH